MNRRRFFGVFFGGAASLAVPKPWWQKLWDWAKPKPYPYNTVAIQLEKVRSQLPKLFERDDYFFKMIEKRDVEKMYPSRRVARIPLKVTALRSGRNIHIHFPPERLPQ